jgi:ribosome-associated protein
MEDPMPVAADTWIPLSEITLRASRSSGPGGQHTNVTASRIEASFDVAASTALSEDQKQLVGSRLGPRVTAIAQDERSQSQNRELALARLQTRLSEALQVPAPRIPTRPTRASRRRRLTAKREQAQRKRERQSPDAEGD